MNSHRTGYRRWLWVVPFGISAVVAIKSVLVLFLWNALIPDLFHGPTLTFLQAVEVVVLAKLLVGFGGGHGGGRWKGHHRWKAHWAALSPEEKEKLRTKIRERCGE